MAPPHALSTATALQAELARLEVENRLLREQLAQIHSLAASRQSLHTALEAAQLALWEWDMKSGEVSLSPRWGSFIGAEQLESRNSVSELLDRVHPEDTAKVRQQIEDLLTGRTTRYAVEHRVQTPNGYIWIESTGMASQRDSTGRITRLAGTNADITSRKAAQRELAVTRAQAEQASQAKSDFLANMSHEVRTPLNAITGLTRLLHKTSVNREQQGYLRLIDNSATNLLALLNDVLDLSKIEAGKLIFEEIRFDLHDWIENCVSQVAADAAAKGLQIHLDMEPQLPPYLVGDPGRLRQIIANLLSNAVKFTERGDISVRIWADPRQDGVTAGRVRLLFQVRDSGMGMTADQQQSIFEAFTQADASTTRRFGGTGLGLAICQHLVSRMGGKIRVSSRLGQGSAFRFSAVFSEAPQLASQLTVPAALEARSFFGVRVLLVEDHAVNRLLTQKLLQELGCVTEVATNGAEAIMRWEQGGIDLVLMDIQMPVMGGEEATARIRAIERSGHGHTPIVALTAHALAGDREKYLAAGMDAYASKPVSPDTLTHAMHAALQAGHTMPENMLPGFSFGPDTTVQDLPVSALSPAAVKPFTLRQIGQADNPSTMKTLDAAKLLSRLGGDSESLLEFASAIRDDIAQRLPQLQLATQTADSSLAAIHTHALKGALASAAMDRGAQIARSLEQAGRDGNWPLFEDTLVLLREEAVRIDQALAGISQTSGK